ncbi:cytochrome P450 [Irpex rosettiformis]|uniref:Cytochrome P450 n=1 Tax=Irpex rosettiformis TaxID=378272 RepID=A0ACB8TM24_9APHY|nr:cytochrome P450 [Irpex rosettiformis]
MSLPFTIERPTLATVFALSTVGLLLFLRRLFTCPSKLRHLPQVPITPTILSFLSGQTEAWRTEHLLLPTAKKHNAPVVVIWALGEWYVHVLDHKVAREFMDNRSILKQSPHEDMVFWKFAGTNNIFFADGDVWAKHARAVREVLHRNVPIDTFVTLTHKLFSVLADGGNQPWSSLAHRFALDIVGHSVLGHDFEALEWPNGFLVKQYRDVMHDISQPLYIAFPILERWLPRTSLRARVQDLRARFAQLLALKRSDPGIDFISLMLDLQSSMSDIEYLDNIVTMFMAGHDTTAGALSSVVYYLATHPECQARARDEAMSVLSPTRDIDLERLSYITVTQFQNMPYLNACIRESMRLNGPSVLTIPRISPSPITLGSYLIPPNVPIALNLYAVLHNTDVFGSTCDEFIPERWLDKPQVSSANTRQVDLDAAWMPFSTGPRRCPAMNFSLYEQRTLLSMLLIKYEWTLPQDSKHCEGLKNGLSTFALNLPEDLYIDFCRVR